MSSVRLGAFRILKNSLFLEDMLQKLRTAYEQIKEKGRFEEIRQKYLVQ
ncbi:MAG: hypothetical protein R2941_01105 [Desulfobacterales bacterium]